MPSQELSHFSIAVEDKNILFAIFQKSLIWLKNVLGQGYLSQHVLEFSFLRATFILGWLLPNINSNRC